MIDPEDFPDINASTPTRRWILVACIMAGLCLFLIIAASASDACDKSCSSGNGSLVKNYLTGLPECVCKERAP